MTLRAEIKKKLEKLVPKETEFSVFKPERPEFGDYSSNAAMTAAKILGKDPKDVAEDFKQKLEQEGIFKKIEIAGPGFLNFFISDETIVRHFNELLKAKKLPAADTGLGRKIQVEFISANPTGPLTLANGRGGFFGDVLSNVLRLSGYEVEREYYVNDTGNQIITLGKSILAASGMTEAGENFYKGPYIKDWAKKNKTKVKKFKNKPLKLGQEAAKDFLKDIKSVLAKKSGIKFDRWTSENSLHKKSFVKKALGIFEKRGLVYKKEGALWLKTTGSGDDKDRVLVTKDGFPTYFLADAGHYFETKSRGFFRKINILGPDHYGYVGRIRAAAEILGLKDSRFLVTQAVRLVRDGEQVKMSKRKGEFVAFEDLVDEIGLDAARYFFLERALNTHIDIDLKLAKERSQKNPVYYVQYAYARMSSILRKSKLKKKSFLSGFTEDELKLLKKALGVADVLEDAASDYGIQRLPIFAHEFSQALSHFYRDVKVLGSGKDEPRRLFIVYGARKILGQVLDLMGISAPEKM